ncbi:MAG TPA: hypothetical protein VED40_20235 [Azospirillaceae bacterium]|nr:hypothetical protein [Azospirillaceae bacterium]
MPRHPELLSLQGTGASGLRLLLGQLREVRGDGPLPRRQRQELYGRIQEWLEVEAAMPKRQLFSIEELPPDRLLVAHIPRSLLDPALGYWRMARLDRWLADRAGRA